MPIGSPVVVAPIGLQPLCSQQLLQGTRAMAGEDVLPGRVPPPPEVLVVAAWNRRRLCCHLLPQESLAAWHMQAPGRSRARALGLSCGGPDNPLARHTEGPQPWSRAAALGSLRSLSHCLLLPVLLTKTQSEPSLSCQGTVSPFRPAWALHGSGQG